jgi:hypothetical protein
MKLAAFPINRQGERARERERERGTFAESVAYFGADVRVLVDGDD